MKITELLKQNALSKATGAELDTATNDVKFATALALANSKYFKSDETETLTNKRITKRVKTFTSKKNQFEPIAEERKREKHGSSSDSFSSIYTDI